MDDLISALASSRVSDAPNNTAAPHPRFALYKVKRNALPQEERRRKFLLAQKLKRYDYVNHARHLAENDWSSGSEAENEEYDEMDWDSQPKKLPRSYKNQLMFSEWFVEVPKDLDTHWLLVLCPIGKRSLVVASQGYTKVYTKSGYLINSFPSELPGGSKKQRNILRANQFSAFCLLDCIYNELLKTYFILDVMCWNSHPLFDTETEFRFYWIHSKIKEVPEVQEVASANPYKFIPLPYYSCDKKSIHEALWSSLPFPCQLDGLLFYHKQTHYTPGSTPLVGWLKAYMVPEILQISTPDSLCTDKPSSYVCMQQHIPEAFEKNQKRKEQEELNMQWQQDEQPVEKKDES